MEALIRAPRGLGLRTKGWKQEAALRMLMNSLDPEVAEPPHQRIVRDRACYDAIVRTIESLGAEDTLLVRSGGPVGVVRTQEAAPRVLIANSSPERSGSLDRRDLMLHGRMAAGSWTSTGTQDALQATFETFAEAARRHFGGSLSGKLVVSGGMGRMGGAQPLAAVMNGAAFLGIEADPERIKRRLRGGYCDIMVTSLAEAVRILRSAVHQRQATSVGLVGNCAEVLPEMVRRGIVPDLLTDQTRARDPLNGYIPSGFSAREAAQLRAASPEDYKRRSTDSSAVHARAMLDLARLGAVVFEYGGGIRPIAEGREPLRWSALSGEPRDIGAMDALACRLFPGNEDLVRWIGLAKKWIRLQGLPARACWLGRAERLHFALEANRMVASGELKGPVVISIDLLDGEAPREGTMLNAMAASAAGASWVAVEVGGDEGAGCSLELSRTCVACGGQASAGFLERVMTCDTPVKAGPTSTP